MGEKSKNTIKAPFSLGAENRSTHIWVDNGDKMLLKSYKVLLKTSMTGANHVLLGTGARCLEEKHIEQIAFLEERVRAQARIIYEYLTRYGKLQAKD